jgi:topoisomerase IA-like protein
MPSISVLKNEDKLLGKNDDDEPIYISKNKYGWCVKLVDSSNKCRYGSINELDHNTITLEQAIECLQYPKFLGKIGSNDVNLCKGKYGLYYKIGSKMISIKDSEKCDLEHAKELYDNSEDNNSYLIGKVKVYVKTGDYGPYIMIPHGSKKPTFISIPNSIDYKKITAAKIKELMDKNKKK